MATPDDGGRYEVAVLGLGLVGAAALRHLCEAGVRCVGIGPAEPVDWSRHGGVFASHYDSGRITRRLDKQREWAVLAGRSIDAYSGIEAASGISFHHPVGVVIAEVDGTRLASTVAVADALGVPFQSYAPGQPFGDDRVDLPGTATVLREGAPGGFIDPRRMLAAQLAVATQHGARLVSEQASTIEAGSAGGWSVHTSEGSSIVAEQVLIATGPHADELDGLRRRPVLDVVAETVVLARIPVVEQERLAGLPSIIVDDPDHDHLYTVPPTEYPDGFVYMKLGATHHEEQVLSPPERRSWMRGHQHEADVDWLRDLLLGLIPGLQADAWLTKPCLIPDTPTKLPYVEIVDPGCVVAIGGNGYAAKSADAIGALAAGLVVSGRWTDNDLDEEKFRLISRS
ncbi:MAG TPA: FAD-dependent oxidoreductase [Ilumatobacteraceae bacterium]|nr:FAD-dependent oxidoreductase [Ilumatobacteraceae bacterium]